MRLSCGNKRDMLTLEAERKTPECAFAFDSLLSVRVLGSRLGESFVEHDLGQQNAEVKVAHAR